MTRADVSVQLSSDQRRALAYVVANAGCTTRTAALALGRSRLGMLHTLQTLEGRGLVKSDYPNRAGAEGYQWDPTPEAVNA